MLGLPAVRRANASTRLMSCGAPWMATPRDSFSGLISGRPSNAGPGGDDGGTALGGPVADRTRAAVGAPGASTAYPKTPATNTDIAATSRDVLTRPPRARPRPGRPGAPAAPW